MNVALATVFVLNSAALYIFPLVGHWSGLSQEQFGTWAALAIHDTSSVVGAGAAYGEEALEIATVTKLARAIWIAPLALGLAWWAANIARREGHKAYHAEIAVYWTVRPRRDALPHRCQPHARRAEERGRAPSSRVFPCGSS